MKAFSTLILIIAIFTVGVTAIGTLASRNISSIQEGISNRDSIISQHLADSCTEESLRRLKDELSYEGGNIPINNETNCEVTVIQNTPTQKEIHIAIEHEGARHERSITLEAQETSNAINITISNWEQ